MPFAHSGQDCTRRFKTAAQGTDEFVRRNGGAGCRARAQCRAEQSRAVQWEGVRDGPKERSGTICGDYAQRQCHHAQQQENAPVHPRAVSSGAAGGREQHSTAVHCEERHGTAASTAAAAAAAAASRGEEGEGRQNSTDRSTHTHTHTHGHVHGVCIRSHAREGRRA